MRAAARRRKGTFATMKPALSVAAVAALLWTPGAALGQVIAPGQAQFGALAEGDAVDHRGAFFDCRDFVGAPGQDIEIVMRSIDIDAWVALHRGAGCQGDWEDSDNDSGVGYGEARLEATLDQGGSWSFRAGSDAPRDTGDYTVSLALAGTADAIRLRADPRDIALGDKVSGELSSTDPATAPGRYFDCFRIAASEARTVALSVTSTAFAPSATLYRDPSCRRGFIVELAEEPGAEGGAGGEFRATALLPRAGVYFLAVTSDRPRQTGAYALTLSAVTDAIR